jgi:AraC family transcriptional regulator of adaptative response / DNA-3-methyladenine glycosylase II
MHALQLDVRPPFDAAALLAFLRVRAVSGVEEVTAEGAYRRSLRLPGGPAVIELRGTELRTSGDPGPAADAARRLLDLDTDPGPIAATLRRDPRLRPLVDRSPGLRVPGHPDPFELSVRAVLGQQVTVAAARRLAERLVERYGEPLDEPLGAVTHLFPSREALATAELPGMPRTRAGAIRALASTDVRDLEQIPGIGPWTAAYVRMRLGDPDVFLPGDAGVRRGLEAVNATPADAARWRPYRSYAVMHLWSVSR